MKKGNSRDGSMCLQGPQGPTLWISGQKTHLWLASGGTIDDLESTFICYFEICC